MKPIFFISKGSYKEIIRDDKLKFKCPFCGLWFNGLAYHTNQAHDITGKELRRMMGLKSKYQLITPSLKERHREIVLSNSDSHIKNNLLLKGKNTRYKDNHIGHIKEKWSNQAIEEMRIKGKKQFLNLIHNKTNEVQNE